MLRIDAGQRRARLALRHHLAGNARADDVTAMVDGVVAVNATDPASVHLAALARLVSPDVKRVEDALYEQRSLLRMHAMRRTMFVVPTSKLDLFDAACGRAVAERERKILLKTLAEAGVDGDVAAWLAPVEEATLAALHARGEASGRELSSDVPALRTSFVYGKGKTFERTVTITTRVLNLLAAEGRIVRGRPAGTWASGQYRWVATDTWLGTDRDRAGEAGAPLTAPEARVRLVEAWLGAFGPATVDDIRWWSGLTLGQVRAALSELDTAEVELEDGPGIVLADDQAPVTEPEPWVALLPALDPTAMGWKHRDWYLNEHARKRLFDRNGNVGPTVWCNGRIVGGWAQRKGGTSDGEIVYELFEDLGSDLEAEVAASAHRLGDLHGDVRVIPRFRTPLERELTA